MSSRRKKEPSNADRLSPLGVYYDEALAEIESIHREVSGKLEYLSLLAAGFEIAFERLVSLGIESAELIAIRGLGYPERAKNVAMRNLVWPVTISNCDDFPENLTDLRRRLQIGASYPMGIDLRVSANYKSSTGCRRLVVSCVCTLQAFSAYVSRLTEIVREGGKCIRAMELELRRTAARKHPTDSRLKRLYRLRGEAERVMTLSSGVGWCERRGARELKKLIRCIEISGRDDLSDLQTNVIGAAEKLPELCVETRDEWCEAIKRLIMIVTGGKPEQYERLREIGEFKVRAYFNKNRTVAEGIEARKKSEQKKGKLNSTIATRYREGLFERVESILESLVKRG